MSHITNDHVEWAVVGRLRRMLDEPPHKTFNVTQSHALFAAILCWVMQRVRASPGPNPTGADLAAAKLFERLKRDLITKAPWNILAASSDQIVRLGEHSVHVPRAPDFDSHTVDRLLVNLRNAVAHGDARNVHPFNLTVGNKRLLAGFTFHCAETDKRDRKKIIWRGQLTLLEADLRRVGSHLAKLYCDTLRHSAPHRRHSQFGADAARGVREAAA